VREREEEGEDSQGDVSRNSRIDGIGRFESAGSGGSANQMPRLRLIFGVEEGGCNQSAWGNWWKCSVRCSMCRWSWARR